MVSLTALGAKSLAQHVTLTPWMDLRTADGLCKRHKGSASSPSRRVQRPRRRADFGSIRARVGLWPIACAKPVVWEPPVGTTRAKMRARLQPISSVGPHQSRTLFRSSSSCRPADRRVRTMKTRVVETPAPPFGALRDLMAA
ncbi:hypothetical protein MRX96_027791 [Rhipicephalus microplus]